MAHFAELDENNIVKQVIIVSNDDCDGGNFPESESIGQQFLSSIDIKGNFKQTSYNNNFRKQYAGIGFKYDEENDVFIEQQPYPSWSLDENFDWQAPILKPEEGLWKWNEELGNWEELISSGE